MKTIAYISLLFIFFYSCESATHVDKEEAIEEKVQERLAEFERVITARCQKKILEEAEALADSIILERARLLTDSLTKPEKPGRPERPATMRIKDSLFQLAPLFKETEVVPASSTLKQ